MAATSTHVSGHVPANVETGRRVVSVDILRGLTIIAMVWSTTWRFDSVKSASAQFTVPAVPQWMQHMAAAVDGFNFRRFDHPDLHVFAGRSSWRWASDCAQESTPAVIGPVLIRSDFPSDHGLFDINRYKGTLGWAYGTCWTAARCGNSRRDVLVIVWLGFSLQRQSGKAGAPGCAQRGARFAA